MVMFVYFLVLVKMARVELRGVNNKDDFIRRVQESVKSKFPAHALFCIYNSSLFHQSQRGHELAITFHIYLLIKFIIRCGSDQKQIFR